MTFGMLVSGRPVPAGSGNTLGARRVTDRVMKTLTAFALVLSFPALVLGQAPAVARSFLITPGQGIGAVQLGMTIAQVHAALGHEAGAAADPTTRTAILTWKTAGAGRFGVWFSNGKAVNVAINRDPRYATAQGLRYGDPADKVRSVMGAPADVASLPSVTLGRLEVLRYPGILFYIPSGAADAALNGKVYSIIVAAASDEAVAPSAPPVQAQPVPAQPAPPVQAQPASPPLTSLPVPTPRPTPAGGPAAAPPSNHLYMVRIGPLTDRDRATAIAKQLSAGGFPQAQVSAQTGYRVVSEPLPRQVAEKLAATLAARGLHTSTETLTGDTIQLVFGVFASQKDAATLSGRIAAAGYDAWIREGPVYTLRLGPYPQASLNAITGIVRAGAPEATVATDPISTP